MIQVNISNHPKYGFKRKATWTGLFVPADLTSDLPLAGFATMGNEVILYTIVQYFEEDGITPVSIVPNQTYQLKADRGTYVNGLGEIVPEFIDGEPNPDIFMDQYSFFMMLVDTGQEVNFKDMIIKHMTDADTLFQRYD
jgi:hypothetical protein